MQAIDYIEVYVNARENTPNIYRIHSVISYDSKGNEINNYQELAYNEEFNDSNGGLEQEIIKYVASKIGVDTDVIEIKGYS